jgi:hypothetical protein
VVSPSSGLSQLVPSNPPQVAIIPTAACSNAELAASVTDYGLRSMNLLQDIVTVTSKSSCFLNGYPSISFTNSSDQASSVATTDGGTFGGSNAGGNVALGAGLTASFVLQYTNSDTCPVATNMLLGIAGSTPVVTVSLAPMGGDQTGWSICGGAVNLSAFEQGNSASQYLS